MAIDNRLKIYDEQGNLVDYDIMATDVKFSDGKDLPTKLTELEDEIGDAGGGYEPPVGGIPKEDLAPGVQTSLGLADTAYQKPNTGIPATDIAPGVIPDVNNLAMKTELANKVDKVTGKGLSTNDYTDAEQTKLAGLPTNPVTSISVNGQTPQTPNNGNVNLVIEAGAQGQKGDKGDTVVIGDEEEFLIVNDLVSGGEADALSAEMGRRLAMLSGTFAEAWAHAQAIPYIFPWLWVETVGGDAICKPIWHRGSGNFVDAAGGSISVVVTGSAGDPTIGGTEGATVPKDTVITITPASGCALHYSVDGGSTYKVADRAVNITLSTAGAKTIMAYCSNPNGSTTPVTRHITVSGTAVPTFAAKPNSGTTLTQKTGYIEVSRGGYVRISGTENGTLYYSTDGENYTEVQGNNYYDFQIANSSYETTAFVIYAKNKVGNDFSDPVTGTFKMAALQAPSFSPAAGTLPMGGGTIEITHTDNNVDIFYTTDGSTPTASSTKYTGTAIAVTSSMTLKAIAKDNYGTSEVATAAYEVPVDHKFQYMIKLTGDNSTEYIPVSPDYVTINGQQVRNYTMTVDWGDGSDVSSYSNKLFSKRQCSHAYTGAAGDEFTITIKGSQIPSLMFGGWSDNGNEPDTYYNSACLVAILENSLECDTRLTIGGANCTSVPANVMQNNIGTWTKFPALATVPTGLLNHLTKTALLSCRKMFEGLSITLTPSNMAELKASIGSVTAFNMMFFDFTGVCDIPDDFLDGVTDGTVTTFLQFVDSQNNGESCTVKGDNAVLQAAINLKKTSSGTTTNCLRGLKARTT
jgi:hypothetical protein